MSDDIVKRLMICARYDPDQKEAAEEIKRLRALLLEARNFMPFYTEELRARIDTALNEGGGDDDGR